MLLPKEILIFSPLLWGEVELCSGEGLGCLKFSCYTPLMDRKTKTAFARRLRREDTKAEALFWREVRGRHLGGYKFRRQVSIGNYFADFVCESAKLIVEFDGDQHAEMLEEDASRTAELEKHGYRVIRFWNGDLFENFDRVMDEVLQELTLATS